MTGNRTRLVRAGVNTVLSPLLVHRISQDNWPLHLHSRCGTPGEFNAVCDRLCTSACVCRQSQPQYSRAARRAVCIVDRAQGHARAVGGPHCNDEQVQLRRHLVSRLRSPRWSSNGLALVRGVLDEQQWHVGLQAAVSEASRSVTLAWLGPRWVGTLYSAVVAAHGGLFASTGCLHSKAVLL